jgi:hypothetical protein
MKRITTAAATTAPVASAIRSKPLSTIRSNLSTSPRQHPRMKVPVVVMFSTLQEKSSVSAPPVSRQYHMVFSTSCDPFQDWQSLAFFYFAHRIQQPGHITRIVSGCTPEQAQARQLIHEQKIEPLNPKYFHLYVTPNYTVMDWGIKNIGTNHLECYII